MIIEGSIYANIIPNVEEFHDDTYKIYKSEIFNSDKINFDSCNFFNLFVETLREIEKFLNSSNADAEPIYLIDVRNRDA